MVASISIHLMLLFISQIAEIADRYIAFQYISCYCLSESHHLSVITLWHFNTSHVTVYRRKRKARIPTRFISIHLMLLFIKNLKKYVPPFDNFNTSHVTVYQRELACANISAKISIHLMLLFIVFSASDISLNFYFNTSHVTVYQWNTGKHR